MARKCDLSDRKTISAGNRKHVRGSSGAGGRWRFKATRTLTTKQPNLRKARVVDPTGRIVTLKISMKVYKKLRQGSAVEGYRLSTPVYQVAA
jgi:ribosomal protein L28